MPIPLDQMEEKQLGRIVLTQERMGQLARLPRKCYRLPGVTRQNHQYQNTLRPVSVSRSSSLDVTLESVAG